MELVHLNQQRMIDVLLGRAGFAAECGDSKSMLRLLPDACIDAIVTDPPYELGFMGRGWDKSGIAFDVELWAECLRVLKPGGHLLAFSGSRTYHRMTCAIEDAGFEIRDQALWLYGSGMPKSRNVAKYDLQGEDAERWAGWGTCLKPSHEPIAVARKPLAGTVAQNLLQHGVGALNIDGCRVGDEVRYNPPAGNARNPDTATGPAQAGGFKMGADVPGTEAVGRWPANLLHDGSPEVEALFPGDAARFFYCPKPSRADRNDGVESGDAPVVAKDATMRHCETADWSARNGNPHPTVKPTELMRYLVRLVCPPGGVVLDVFMGSGSTGRGARMEGCRFIGFDLSPEFTGISRRRIAAAEAKAAPQAAIAPAPVSAPIRIQKTPPAPADAVPATPQMSLL